MTTRGRAVLSRTTAVALRRGTRGGGSGLRIVVAYHGVRTLDQAAGLFPPKLDLATFRAHLDHLRRHYDVLPLGEVLSGSSKQASRPRLALTFDDDLRGHADLVAPLLIEHGLPATFFLTGSSLDGSGFREWWHDVEALAGREGVWPRAVERLATEWPWAAGTAPAEFAETLLRVRPAEREEIALELRELAGEPGGDRGLDDAAVRELVRAGFDVGFHTLRHEPLDTLSDGQIAAAMTDGLERLATASGREPRHIAYPHGRADLRAAHAAGEAGFELGFGIAQEREVREADRPLMLPRVDPCTGTPDVDHFAFRLARITFAASRRR